MTRKELIITGKIGKIFIDIVVDGEEIATIRGESIQDIDDFYYINTGGRHASIEKTSDLIISDYRVTKDDF